MTKKILSIVLSVLLLVSIVPNFAFAADEFAIAGNAVDYEIGQETKTVDVTFNVSNNPGITNAGLEVKFDPDVMTYKAIKSYGVVFAEADLTLGDIDAAQGSLYLIYSNGLQDLTTNGELITITFEMAETVEAGTYEVEILEDDFSGGVSDTVAQPFDPVCTAATVEVKAATTPPPATAPDLIYTAQDIIALEMAKGGGNVEVQGLVEDTDAAGYSSEYVRYVVKSSKIDGTTTGTKNDFVLVYLPEGVEPHYANPHVANDESDYKHVVVGYKTNIAPDTNVLHFVYAVADGSFNDAGTEPKAFNTYDNRVGTDTATRLQQAMSAKLKTAGTSATANPVLDYVRFLPYGAPTAANAAIVYTAEQFFDIEYVAFFADEADATAFDYAEYVANLTPPAGATPIVVGPEELLAESAGKNATLSVITEGGKTYLRATMSGTSGNGINWTIDPVVDATVYDVVKIGFKTNAGAVYNRGIALQASKDNTFNWEKKYFDAANYTYWPEAMTEVTADEVVFDMTGKAATAGTDTLQYFRILPFNGQATYPIEGETTLYFDIEYVAFFDSVEAANDFTYVAPVNEYTVTFQDKDGGEISTDTYEEGETVTLPTAPEVAGFTFLGWSTGVEGAALVTENFTAAADVTLKAIYEETQGGDAPALDCVIITTDEIVAGDNPDNITGVGTVGSVLNYGLVDGMARFAVPSSKAGTASSTNDRLAIKVDNVLFKDYPYAVIAYETNIAVPDFNFNIATANGTYSSTETKLFGPQARVAGELTTANYTYTGKFGDTAEVIGVYVPIYSTTSANFAEGDYMSVKYVGFFKNATDAAAFDYEAYLESLEGGDDEGGEGDDLEGDEDTEYLGTFITILKMITAKKKAGGTTTTIKGIVYNAEDIIANRAVTEGVDTYAGKEGKFPGGKVTFSAVEGKVRFVMPAGTASGTGDRAIIKVDDVKLTEYPYYAIKYNTNIAADNINLNLTTKDGTYSGAEQKIFAPVAREVGKDAVCIAKYDGKMGDAVATFVYVPIYSNTSAVAADGDYFDVIAVGFFKTEADAKAFVDYNGNEVTPEVEEPKEEPKEEEPVATGEPVIYAPADLLAQIAPQNGEFSTVEKDGKTYLRFSAACAEEMNAHAFNWSMATPLDTTVYKYAKVAFKTNVASVTNGAMAVQVSGDNTFNWQTKVFDVTEYGFWADCTSESSITHVFDMSDKIDQIGVDKIEYFRFLPFNGQIITTLDAADLYVDVEYIAFFKDAKDAENYGK